MTKIVTRSKYIYFLAMLYISLIVLPSLVGYKLIQTPHGVLSAASLLSPFWFVLGDIIAEVYGYKASVKMFLSAIACEIIIAGLGYFLINLPSPAGWSNQAAYDLIIGRLPRIFLFQVVGVSIAWMINAFLITRWKFMLRGRYFWLRSIGSSGIGETLFVIISVSLTLLGTVSLHDVSSIVVWSFCLKLVVLLLFAFPANLITNFLKKKEGLDIYDNPVGFNPFKADLKNE